MDRLVKVDPSELNLHFRPSYRCTATFKITSLIHTMPVAVKLSTLRPSSYSFSPSPFFLLPPLSSSFFTLLLLPTASPPLSSPPDLVLVGTALAPALRRPNSASLRLFFSRPSLPLFRDASIPIHLIGPHALRSILSRSDSSISISSLLSRVIPSCTPPELSAALLIAAAGITGGGNAVSALISAGANPNSRRGGDGRSAISLAVSAGCAEAVEVLVKAGATDRPLNEAAAGNRTDLILFLLAESDVGIDWADSDGRTAVHAAAAEGSVEALRFCLSCGGDAERIDGRGWTPLHYAAAGGHREAIEILMKSSDLNLRLAVTGGGKWWLRRKTAFDIAVRKGHSHLFEILRPEDEVVRAARCGKVAAVSASSFVDEDQPVWESHGEAASAAAVVNVGN